MKSISEIKTELIKDDEAALKAFVEIYSSDERDGVKKLVASAEKSLLGIENEKKRMWEMFHYERLYPEKQYIAGIDEVGRGPLAGPVVTCALILPKDCNILHINDSKKLSAKERDRLYDLLNKEAVSYAIGIEGPETIDDINILQATIKAMKQAVSELSVKPDQLFIDAVKLPDIDIDQRSIIKGDAKSASIAAASIVAKVTRDRMMEEYDKIYPGYGFASNKGYGSADHIKALKELGPCEIHRRSFIGNFI
ncbi:MAG: ribonuclease HII [Lachnospiraceae bacterium]|nr:ribonuclease HII [Lachnospiraceae bacterium]